MLVETIRRITPWGVLRPTLAGCTPGPSFSSKLREVDVLNLDLAGLDVGNTSVVSHDFPP